MKRDDMSVQKASRIRRKLIALIDDCEIYPRHSSHIDAVSLALFSRMAELHKTICLLVGRNLHRDAVILARTLFEAWISYYWLTNKNVARRFDRYVKFAGIVHFENISRGEKWSHHRYTPTDSAVPEFIEEARKIFRKASPQWNEETIRDMAAENDEYGRKPDGSPVNLLQEYELWYFWFSLHSHPGIWAIQDFRPASGNAFLSNQVSTQPREPLGQKVVILSTIWFYAIADRMNTVLKLSKEKELKKIVALLRARQ